LSTAPTRVLSGDFHNIMLSSCRTSFFFFFFNDPATTEIYTLSLHDALPIYLKSSRRGRSARHRRQESVVRFGRKSVRYPDGRPSDRKSTRLNSSHDQISYAVFCLKKKKNTNYKEYIANLKYEYSHTTNVYHA